MQSNREILRLAQGAILPKAAFSLMADGRRLMARSKPNRLHARQRQFHHTPNASIASDPLSSR